jgi:hydroxymethylglutaryl-CoA synthase
MAQKAHVRLVTHELARRGRPAAEADSVIARTLGTLVEPALGAARLVGNTYTASLYLCLAWLAETAGARLEGARLGLFSYGSGCCAEFFTGRLVAGCGRMGARIGLGDMLARRRRLTVEEYEAFARGGTIGDVPAPTPTIRFLGVRDDRRVYAREEGAP